MMTNQALRFLPLLVFTLLFSSCSGNTDSEERDFETVETTDNVEFDTYNQKISYCIGLDHARGAFTAYTGDKLSEVFDIGQIEAGMIDYLAGNELRIDITLKDSLLELYLLSNGEVNPEAVSMKDASYCIGLDEGFVLVSSLVGREIDQEVDVEFMLIGIREGFSNTNSPIMPYMEARREVEKYYNKLNLENGAAFLAENRTYEGVFETESGLQYEIIKEGTGKKPNITDSVTIHYTGRYIDGRVFESTIPSNVPYQGSLMNVIDGWQEGVMMMREGGQRRLYIPHQLAYGEKGKGVIEPNSTLIFDIELLKVKSPD